MQRKGAVSLQFLEDITNTLKRRYNLLTEFEAA